MALADKPKFRDEVKNLPRWKIKEPDDAEFQKFKKDFLNEKAKKIQQSHREKILMTYIGQLQSYIDEMKEVMDNLFEQKCKEMTAGQYKDFMLQLMAKKLAAQGAQPGRKKDYDRMAQKLIQYGIKW
jgi:hypothetical protein